jgi:predicted O-methyltransferase YrrM
MAKVTVYIPAYNHERFVGDAIRSVLSQTFADLELIVADDGSSDGTLSEIRRFKDPRLKIFALPHNLGEAAASNFCLTHATGDFVSMLSSDDQFVPDKVQRQVTFLENHPEFIAVAAQPAFINEDGHSLDGGHAFANVFTRENRSRESWLRHFYLHGNCLCHPTAMFRREAYKLAGGGEHELLRQLNDFDFWVRVCMIGQIHVMEDQLTLFRVRSGNQNVSAPTLENCAMAQHEMAFVLRHYLQTPVLQNLAGIFGPEYGPPRLPHLALAEIAWAQGSPAHRRFAVDAMLEAPTAGMDDGERTELLKRARPFLRAADVFRERELARLSKESMLQSMEVARLSTAVAQLSKNLRECEAGKQRLREKKCLAEDKLAATRAKLEDARSRLTLMKESLGWRLTKPLRKLSRLWHGKDFDQPGSSPERSPLLLIKRNGIALEEAGAVNDLASYLKLSETIPGWTRNDEAYALARMAHSIEGDAVIVEIGTFLGSSTVFLAGSRKLRGSGRVYCVDPFDGSGDSFSIPHYREIITASGARSPLEQFEKNLRSVGLSNWVEVHQGTAEQIAPSWTTPIDLLVLDGDQSPAGARAAYECWSPWLKPGGVIALHNSNPRAYAAEHDGHYLVATEEIHPPSYFDRHLVGSFTFARKAAQPRARQM